MLIKPEKSTKSKLAMQNLPECSMAKVGISTRWNSNTSRGKDVLIMKRNIVQDFKEKSTNQSSKKTKFLNSIIRADHW